MNYTMKEALDKCHTTRKAIRYYEQQGLLTFNRTDGIIMISEDEMMRLQCILYYRNMGLKVHAIKDLLSNKDSKQNIVDILESTYDDLNQKVIDKEKEVQVISNVLDNLYDKKDIYEHDPTSLFTLNEDNMVYDTMIPPFRLGGVYWVKDIICTKKEYQLLRISMRIFIVLLIIVTVIGMYKKLSGY